MNLTNAILIGLKEIWSHKFRSALTMLGIILGVSSLVAMSAIVKGMENGMKEALIALGGLDKALTEQQPVPPRQEHLADMAPGRTIQDVYALKESAPLLRLVSPEMALPGAVLTRGGRGVTPSELVGVWREAVEMNLHELQHGRFFSDLDDELANSVCVIGTGLRDELFGSPEQIGREIVPLGEIININGQPFTIVGMFAHYESEADKKAREALSSAPEIKTTGVERRRGYGGGGGRGGRGGGGGWVFRRKNMTAFIPLNTMWVKFRSASGTNGVPDPRLTDIDLKVASMEKLEPALQQARNVLMLTHRGIEDFTFQTQENSVDSINITIRNARMSGGIIAAISLLVGGIGIMNIMLASITERVREIGIRKAVGATTFAIFTQILVESVVISLVGGVAGLAASYGFVNALQMLTPSANAPVITLDAMIAAFLSSAAIGMAAGLIPAVKAAKLDPIQALRYD